MLTLEAGIVIRKMSPLLTRYSKESLSPAGARRNTASHNPPRYVGRGEKDVPEIDFRAFVFCSGLVCARANGQCSRNRLWIQLITVLDNQKHR
uniref:Uncharacterized protein n=1 Tax=Timema monikensis TaxID=170555 RepID=A0A7R9E5J0_9NEOP|nr:unnamed protein product [Timema monikensis]